MPEDLAHGLAVEQVDGTHVTSYPTDDLPGHHLVEVRERLVYEGVVKVAPHDP